MMNHSDRGAGAGDRTAEAAPVIRARGIRMVFAGAKKQPDTVALDHVDIQVPEGEMMALIGPDGAGKTTTFRMLFIGLPVTAGTAAGYVSSIATTYSQELTGQKGLVTLVSRTWYNPNEITRWMFMPQLIGVLALTQVLMLAGLSVARERENGTFDQLLVTPLQPQEILIGKAVPPIVVGIFQCTIMFLLALFWFEVPFAGSVGLLYLVIVVFLLSCVGIGLTISAISATMQQVMVYNFTCMLPMILLSGLATPVANMPVWMQYFTYVNPLRFAIEALRRVYLEGASFELIAGNFVPLLIITCITMPVAAWMFRHKLA